MKRDPKPPALINAVPVWAQEPLNVPARQGNTSLVVCGEPNAHPATRALLRVDDAAMILKVSSKTIQRLVARGHLKAVRIGRSVRIPSSEIDHLIAAGCPSEGGFRAGEDDD